MPKTNVSRTVAYGGMLAALILVVTRFSAIPIMNGQGYLNLGDVTILFVALAFGPAWGMGVGAVYGLLQFVIEPYSAHWASVILDYPLAFGLLGLAGFFAVPKADRLEERQILRRLGGIRWPMVIVAVLTGMFGRTISHVLSGIVFYASYAGDQNPLIYSLVYNLSYMVPEAMITLIILVPLAAVFRKKGN